MCDRLHLNSMKQTETPLNKVFFSDFNIQVVQKSIRQAFKNKTGVSIDYQNASDLYAIMRVVFINNAGNHYANVNEQVKFMNSVVIKTTLPKFSRELHNIWAISGILIPWWFPPLLRQIRVRMV